MDLTRARNKLDEAKFFLHKMDEEERRINGDKKPFDYYLSAFLSAAMSVRTSFHVQRISKCTMAIKAWREAWEGNLGPDERQLYDFMRKDRNAEVHTAGSRRTVAQEGRKLGIGIHNTGDSIITVSGPPGVPPAIVCTPTFKFIIGGVAYKTTESCAAYLALLQRMVVQIEAQRP